MSFTHLTINGKFLAKEPTGVHRVAGELLRRLDASYGEIAHLFSQTPEVLMPRDVWRIPPGAFPARHAGLFSSQLWEQIDLPRLAQGSLLLNFCNLGPIASRAAITMIHDAQVFSTPGSYSWAFRNWYRAVLPLLGKRHARILTVSDYSAEELARYGVAPRDQISVVHNGVDHLLGYESSRDAIARLGLRPLGFALGLANLQVHKNIGVLLRAFAAPEMADIKLVLVGGARREAFEALDHKVPDNVVFAGRVSDGELRGLLEEALCVAFPSRTEGFGLPPLEGMTLGCPAIVAPCGSLPELCGDATPYASPDDPREWIAALRLLADDAQAWESWSARGRAQAALFTWKRAGEALIRIIREVAEATPPKR